jgi:hypothetical protein
MAYDKKRPTMKEDLARMFPARAAGAKLVKGHYTRPTDLSAAAERVQSGGATSKVRVKANQLEKINKRQTKTP